MRRLAVADQENCECATLWPGNSIYGLASRIYICGVSAPPKPPFEKTARPRPSRGKSGKPAPPPVETGARTPGFGEASQNAYTVNGPLGGLPTLPALRQSGPRPPMGGESLTENLTALLTKPHDRSERANELLSRQPLMATHPLVAGTTADIHTAPAPSVPRKAKAASAFKIVSEYEPKGDQPHRHRRTRRRRQQARTQPGAARRHRLGQDVHDGAGHRGDPAPGTGPGAEQDAGRPALRRVQELLSGQRGGVFRLVLRLLPARSLRAAHRHLHREGSVDQRADRPHAPRRDARAAGTRRRHHRRVGVVHLRYRLGRNLHGDDVHGADGRDGCRATSCWPTSSRSTTGATTRTSCAAPSACAAIPSSCSRPTSRIAPGASRCSATRSRASSSSIR